MTMQNQIHPDDERLSALAGGDPEVTGDAALRAHVDGCARCTSLVRELGDLRVALAQLPDLTPSRPLQLIPPVPEPTAVGGGGWLRRLAAPVMAAGVGMIVVGAVGFGASALGGMAASGGPIFQNVGTDLSPENDRGGAEGETPESARDEETSSGRASPYVVRGNVSPVPSSGEALSGGNRRSPSPSGYRFDESPAPSDGTSEEGAPTVDRGDEGTDPDLAVGAVDFNQPATWLGFLGAGVVLLILGLVLRNSLQPRAG